jgi:outer membrane protein assembly factor BamB
MVSIPLTVLRPPPKTAGWPRWHFDDRNSGQSAGRTNTLTGTVAWVFSVGASNGSSYMNSPVVDPAGNVYQLGMNGTFYALSRQGNLLWSVFLGLPSKDPHPSTPNLLADGSMFVASGSLTSPPNLFRVSSLGAVLNSLAFGQEGFGSVPLVGPDGTLYLGDAASAADPYAVMAFQGSTSTESLVAGLALPFVNRGLRTGVALGSDGTSYWGNNGQFFAVAPVASGFTALPAWPSTGAITANATTPGSPVISDLALDGQVNDFLYASSAWSGVDLATGNATVQGNITALNLANGAAAWTVNFPSTSLGSPLASISDIGNAPPAVSASGTVYVGAGDGLRAIDGATGAILWSFNSANVTAAPAIGGDGTILFGTRDGDLIALNSDGSLRFTLTFAASVSASPAIADDGSVYVVSDDGNLSCIQ